MHKSLKLTILLILIAVNSILVSLLVPKITQYKTEKLYSKLNEIGVSISTKQSIGSGTVITRKNQDGEVTNYIISAGHLFDEQYYNEGELPPVVITHEVILNNRNIGSVSAPAEIIAISDSNWGDDLSILKLRYAITNESARFSKDLTPHLGQKIIFLGCPLGDFNQFTTGVLGKIGDVIGNDYEHYFDMGSAVCYPGNSGGASVNSDGEIIGVVVRRTPNSFYVPLRRIKGFLHRHNLDALLDNKSIVNENKVKVFDWDK